jgi:hypothetical protein
MLAMVASTPNAAAGLAILRERSDITETIPAPAGTWTRGSSAGHQSVAMKTFFTSV